MDGLPPLPANKTPAFQLGRLFITPRAVEALSDNNIITALARHVTGDWGDVDEHDRKENELSLKKGFRLFSVYHAGTTKFWVITEADRSSTTVLLPEDY